MADFARSRARMVERQLRARGISDERVLAAMAEVPRERFVDERLARRAYADSALPLEADQTISQPWVVAAICAGPGAAGRRARARDRDRVGLLGGRARAPCGVGAQHRADRRARRVALAGTSPASRVPTGSRSALATARSARPTRRRSTPSRFTPPRRRVPAEPRSPSSPRGAAGRAGDRGAGRRAEGLHGWRFGTFRAGDRSLPVRPPRR